MRPEEIEKMAAQQNCSNQACDGGYASGLSGARGIDRDQHLLGRIQMQAEQAERESARANDLRELEYLLKENPVTARILDLLGKVRGL